MAVPFGAAARSRMLIWSDRLLGIISRFDNSADDVRGAARPVSIVLRRLRAAGETVGGLRGGNV